MASDLACSIPAEAFEIPDMTISPFTTSTIEARLVSPSASEFELSRVPRRVHSDRPLELELVAVRLGAGAGAAVSVASWIFAHARLTITVDMPGQPGGAVVLHVNARPSGGGCIIRALVHPSAWADAATVTVVSLSLAGRPLHSDCLPATLQVGYNHTLTIAPASAGAVLSAAKAGSVPALWAALEAGGSTDEADRVRGGD